MSQVEFNLAGTNGTVKIDASTIGDIETVGNQRAGIKLVKVNFALEMKDGDGDNCMAGQHVLVTNSFTEVVTMVAAALTQQA